MRRYRALLLLVLLLSLCLSGCVYYNTLYNAKKLYKTAQLRPLTNGKPSSQAIDDYTKAMKKCGYILTEYKNSKYADEALFLLAKCLYYKGNSNLQAYEKCQDFLKFYPNSKQAPEVILFKTVILHEMKRNDEAVSTLQSFLQVPANKSFYPRAYLQLSVISMHDKAYAQAQYFLQKIIDNYPRSREYKSAFFQLGYAYHLEKKYAQSNQVFQKLLKSRLEKRVKLDARYYIALNDYNLKDHRKVETEIKKLLFSEIRPDVIPLIKLLQAKNLLGLNQFTQAVSRYEAIIKDNPKTFFSAEANYYLGEYYLNYQRDYDQAITFYNNVKIESYSSPFVEDALSKSAIASQIILYNKKDTNLAVKDMVNQQLKLAEYYLHSMNLPDSALSVYRRIVDNRTQLYAQLDSLKLRIAYLDSLGVPKDTMKVVSDSLALTKADSLANTRDSLKTVMPDSIRIQGNTITQPDSALRSNSQLKTDSGTAPDSSKAVRKAVSTQNLQQAVQDSSNVKLQSSTPQDSLKLALQIPSVADSTVADSISVQDSVQVVKNKHIDTPEVKDLVLQEEQLAANLMQYDSEFAPLALFDQVWIYKYSIPDSVKMRQVYETMVEQYPLSQYTHAASLMIQDKEIQIITEEEVLQEEKYAKAMELYNTAPDSAKTILKSMTGLTNSPYCEKSKFSLGYICWFNEGDSLQAKPYFDEILKKDRNSDYSTFVLQFYDGKYFIVTNQLASILEMEERDRKKKAEAEEAKRKALEDSKLLIDHPQPKGVLPDYVMPPLLEVKKDEIEERRIRMMKEQQLKQQENQPLPSAETPKMKTVDQPQPKGDYRPYDFILPAFPRKP